MLTMTIRLRRIAFAAALVTGGIASSRLQAVEVAGPPTATATTPEADALARKHDRESELEAIRRSIDVSKQRQDALRADIQGIETDRAKLSADLIGTAQRLRATDDDISRIETRLEELQANEDGVRQSLRNRRAVLADILMALQRMGRSPPPAILSRPEDALGAIRGSIMAGAVLPDIRVEADALAADLKELTQVTARIAAERDQLRTRYASLGEERARFDLLMETKRSQGEQTQASLEEEERKSADLAGKAQSLAGLIQSLEKEVASAGRAADAAREASASSPPVTDKDEAARRLADTSRISPAIRFIDAKGLLTWPVPGDKLMGFGDSDGLGGTAQGLSLATRPGTPVVSPADGWVVYAGPFRSYGQVLILNAGGGYHVVMAGMEKIDAALGQFVLAGEPVAVMGATRLASLGDVHHTSAQPTLYVEFRKDGTAINSAPWWAPANTDEVKG